ncbi:MurR/RpiR family transcriptional regulator [Streptomyces sp.]|uniref:MurR/RpiR family transcriptional regulator n=1 Tax=Streptomyces sp. TaxID=1931 RepID=UPI002D77F08D|nr:MurR/RpiR family transcriptional regulator [Streptomyces sp.]HET6354161.1 MurR/RpiR family transcriptional regulator [Streptomyces sp.]
MPKRPTSNAGDEVPLGTRIRALIPELTAAEQRVARLVLADGTAAAGQTISELASASQTSTSTVMRFCKALGLAGYPQLRLALTAEAAREGGSWGGDLPADGDFGPEAGLAEIVAAVAGADIRAIYDTAAQLDLESLAAVVEAITGAGRIDIYAVGSSVQPATGFQLAMHRTGFACCIWSDVHSALTSAALLGPGAVAIALSHSGQTVETIEALETARAAGATTIAVTNFPKSPLASAADIVLTTAVREGTFRPGGLSCTHPQTTVLDCIYAALAQRDRGRAEESLQIAVRAVAAHRTSKARPPRTAEPT